MNALYLPKQVTQNVTPPPNSATVWADINGKLWFQLPNQAPVQINTGNNAFVPSSAPIHPAQAFVAAMLQYSLGDIGPGSNSFTATNVGITALDPFNLLSSITADGATCDLSGNALNAASINAILAQLLSNGLANGVVNLSGGTNAAPTGQGIADKASLISAGNTVTTN